MSFELLHLPARFRSGLFPVHVILRITDHAFKAMGAEAELPVKLLRVPREQINAATAQLRVLENALEHPPPGPPSTMRLGDDHVAQVADRGAVRDDTGEADLGPSMEKSEVERMPEALRNHLAAAPGRPVG